MTLIVETLNDGLLWAGLPSLCWWLVTLARDCWVEAGFQSWWSSGLCSSCSSSIFNSPCCILWNLPPLLNSKPYFMRLLEKPVLCQEPVRCLRFLPYFQADKLACHDFMVAGRGPETPGSQNKDAVTYSTWGHPQKSIFSSCEPLV